MVMFVPPQRLPKRRPPFVLTDERVQEIFAWERLILTDGNVPVEGKVIGWQKTNAGALGAIVVNPLTHNRFLFGVDFSTGRPRKLGRPKPPKSF